MPSIVRSCRLEKRHADLLSQQARHRNLDVSTLASLYLEEKTQEEAFPGIGFRDSIGGREAYVLGHRVAVWEVAEVLKVVRSVKKCADYFTWSPALVRCALNFAKKFPDRIAEDKAAERAA